MRMSGLTYQERTVLDSLNEFNLKKCGIKNDSQSLWNVCWGYLNNKFTTELIQEPDKVIIDTLREVNKEAPKIKTEENLDVKVDEMYTTVAMSPLF